MKSTPRHLVAIATIACLLLGLSATAATAAKPAEPKATVAVLYFDYSGESAEMGMLRKGLAQMLITDLGGLEKIQLVERDRLQALLDELKLNESKKIDKKTANKIGKLLGAKYLVLGGYFDLMGTLRVDARLVEVETGKVITSVGSAGKMDDFLAIEKKVADDLEKAITSSTVKGVKPRPTRRARKRPKKLAVRTAVKYSKALDAIDKGDKVTAKKELEGVIAEQPDFTLASADLERLIQ